MTEAAGLGWATVHRMIAVRYPEVSVVGPAELAARLGSAHPPLLLDVRTEEEFAVSHLAGAHRVDPDAPGLPSAWSCLPPDTPIVAYCSVGVRSAGFVQRMRAAGFTEARNLDGSIFRWVNEGRPVVRGGSVVRAVHPYNRLWGRLLDPVYRTCT